MVYIFTALYCEAHMLIRAFRLVKNQKSTWFQEFYNEPAGIRLIVTGAGEIAAAAAVGSVCSIYSPTQGDLLLNVGICAHTTKDDGIFLCSKIIEQATGKTFYPDLLYRHNFCEETIVTGMLPWNGKDCIPDGNLYDMEAAAIYQTGSHYFGPHQMSFLKIVSDRGVLEKTPKEYFIERTAHLMETYQDCILDYIRQLSVITQHNGCQQNSLCPDGEKLIETFCTDLHCSQTMRESMVQYIRYLALAKLDYVAMIQDLYDKKLLPCRDKREGKLRFEEFKKRLF